MEKIARKRMATWMSEALADFQFGTANYVTFGFIAFGCVCCLALFSLCLKSGIGQPAGDFIQGIITWIVLAVVHSGLASVALARLHGRYAEAADFQQDLSVHGQAVLAFIAMQVLKSLVVVMAALPGFLLLALGASGGAYAPLKVPGILVMLVGALPAYIAINTLLLFVIPLIVDKHFDFWSALTHSVGCTRRDFPGLAIFYAAVTILGGILAGIVVALTCGLGLVLVLPLWHAIAMRAYRDYFGLDEDWWKPAFVTTYSNYGEPPDYRSEYTMSSRGYGEIPGIGQPGSVPPPEPPRALPIRRDGQSMEVPAPIPPPPVGGAMHGNVIGNEMELDDDNLPPPPPPAT